MKNKNKKEIDRRTFLKVFGAGNGDHRGCPVRLPSPE